MMNNGYVKVDCTGIDLTKGTKQTITGIYKKVCDAMATGKIIIAENLSWGDKPVTPVACFAIDWGSEIIVTASTLQVHVEPNNKVQVTNMAPAQN